MCAHEAMAFGNGTMGVINSLTDTNDIALTLITVCKIIINNQLKP